MTLDIRSAASPETKALAPEAGLTHEALMRAHEAFKETNDLRLVADERRAADVLLDDKLARINAELDAKMQRIERLAVEARRPALGLERPDKGLAACQHKAAFEAYMRSGETQGLRVLETRALSAGSGPDGGYLAPPEVETTVTQRLAAISPIRAIAGVRQVSAPSFKRPFAKTGPAFGWVGETASRTTTDSPVLAEQVFPAMELYAMPAATQTLIDDAAVDLEQWIASEVETVFAEQEGKAFVSGDGTNKPTGFLTQTLVANASWEWGKIGFTVSGAAAAFATANPADRLFDLIYALKAGFRQNGRFVMNRKTQAEVRKFKDESGAYVWQPPAQAGGEASLFTFPVTEAEDMPDIAANATPIAFGDFRRGYLVVDRLGLRILRDPYSAKPYVLFYTTKRVGGGVADYDAIKLMKIAAS
ncbi:phage major capsid protein [Phreatobacter aquaticus]|uniref:Phage major capsid protein n=1 Tax=Phreatobacter aquaticus TaxID=2570229 RepID=A0A4D7QME5_9HYPH|nr:phage major capsid protein [Phreatobacter aquaticus]QCK86626.1 phage major capsid protein [Phreatobacter aquaticus]